VRDEDDRAPLGEEAVELLGAGDPPGVGELPVDLAELVEPGEDRKLATWDELVAYYEKLARTSPRVRLDTLGTTTKGRPFIMLTITSPENHARLDELREINRKLADPRRISGPEELDRLLAQGRTVVLITHEPEVAEFAKRVIELRDGQIVRDVRQKQLVA